MALSTLHLQLEEFEGPLPLLLRLIEREELEITRVSITAVADQFLALVADQLDDDLAATGEFLSIAARLLLIKSRALLPSRGQSADEAGDSGDAEALARQVVDYRRYHAASAWIAERLADDMCYMVRPVAPAKARHAPKPLVIGTQTLRAAAMRLLVVAPESLGLQAEIWPEVDFGVVRADLLRRVFSARLTSFSSLCSDGSHCSDSQHPLLMITLFLAILDAARARALSMQQHAAYGPLTLYAVQADA